MLVVGTGIGVGYPPLKVVAGGVIDNAVLDSADGTPITDSADSNTIITDEEA